MDETSWTLLGLIGAMAINQLVMRVGGLFARTSVFWSAQLLNMALGSVVLVFGLPGLESWPAISWMIGLIFLFRVIQNNQIRVRWLLQRRQDAEDEAERAEIGARIVD